MSSLKMKKAASPNVEAPTGDGVTVTEKVPSWSLDDLYSSPTDAAIKRDLESALAQATSLEERFKGRLAEITAADFANLLQDYEQLQELTGRVGSYAQLLHAARRDDEEIGKFYQSIDEALTGIGTHLLFVTLELNRLTDAQVTSLMADPNVSRFRPWLDVVRAFRAHQLSDELEGKLHERSVTGRSAWVRLFDETMAGLRFPFDGEDLTSAVIFDKLSSSDRKQRERAAAAISQVLGSHIKLFSRISNTLIKDKHIEDGWRAYAEPMSARNLANQVEDAVVDALITSVRKAYPRLSHRYYRIKADWMGIETLEHWDRNAPLPEDSDTRRSWADAKVIVLDAYRQFSPKLAEIVAKFFDQNWIDADPRVGKDGGAFCHPTVPSVHPYVLMNYQGRNRDVMTLAHELGHGVHQVLAGEHGPILSSTPLTLAETASVFGEQLTFRALLAQADDPAQRSLLLASKIEDMLNTVVRQIAFCDFERRVHAARREGELTADEFGKIWMDVQTESLGPAFNFEESYRHYWSYIPHFIHVPFYVYAYAFGDCLVNSLYRVYQENPEGFEQRYLALLQAGGTERHNVLLEPFGLDPRDPDFWDKGLQVIEELIDELEAVRNTMHG